MDNIIDIIDYPPVVFTSLDGTRAILSDGNEVNLNQLAVAYNELRNYVESTQH